MNQFILLSAGCIDEQKLDKAKFAELNQAAQDLKTAIKSGNNCDFPETLLQRMEAGTDALKDKTASKADRDLLSAYNHLLAVYKDGLLVCQTRTLLADFPFLPKGRIYVPQELDLIVERYDLRTERHVYQPTGKYWRSIPVNSIRVIWDNAEAEIRNIENMVKYN